MSTPRIPVFLVFVLAVCVAATSEALAQTESPFSVDLTSVDGFSPLSNPLVVKVEDGKLTIPAPEPRPFKSSADERVGPSDPKDRVAPIGNSDVSAAIAEACERFGVDAALVECVITQESGFRRRAVSQKGASGYMQLMPATARRFGVTDVFDTRQNIRGGVRYLRYLLDLFDGDVALALAGYNAGEARVVRAGYQVPAIAETRNYVKAILARYASVRRRGAVR